MFAMALLTAVLCASGESPVEPPPSPPPFARPYGEPAAAPPASEPAYDDLRAVEPAGDLDEHEPRRLALLGIEAMGAGAGVAAGGGMLVLGSLAMARDSSLRPVAKWAGIGLAIAGGAMFLTGVVITGIDWMVAPAPLPAGSGRGAAIEAVWRF